MTIELEYCDDVPAGSSWTATYKCGNWGGTISAANPQECMREIATDIEVIGKIKDLLGEEVKVTLKTL